jgi:hypothetical protein
MSPSIEYGDLVRENRWALRGRNPVPGEVLAWVVPGVLKPWPAASRALELVGRVVAVPGDAVSMKGADLIVNGAALPQEKMGAGPEAPKVTAPRFLQRIGQREVVTTYGPHQAPKPCLSEQPQVLSSDQFLLATDDRPDGRMYCLLLPRAYVSGLIDLNWRTGAAP